MKNKVFKSGIIYILILLVLSFLPITWFKNNCIINGGDFSFPFDSPSKYISSYFYSWNSNIGLGVGFARGIAQLPYQLFLSFWDKMSFPLQSVERIFFMFIFLLGGISMYFFSYRLTKNETISFISSLFYIFNPFSMIVLWRMITLTIIAYASLPLVCLTFIKSVEDLKPLNLLYFNLAFLIFSSCSNPAFYFIIWFILFSYMFVLYFMAEHNFKKLFVNFLILFFLNIVFSLWWFLPMLADITTEYSRAVNSYTEGGPFDVLNVTTSAADIVELFKLRGYWPFYSMFEGDPYYNYSYIYFTLIFKILGFIIPIIVFLAPLFYITLSNSKKETKKNRVLIIFLIISSLIAIFMLKGTKHPFGKLFYGFLFKIPFSGILRNPIDKIGLWFLLSYSILFGISITGLYKFINKFNRTTSVIVLLSILVIVFFVYLFPFWTSDIIYDGGIKYPSFYVKVPAYYKTANKWLSEKEGDFRMFPYPYLEQYFGNAYKWGYGYIGSNPSEFLFSKALICRTDEMLPQLVFKSLEKQKPDAVKLLGMMSVKYIIFFRDFSWDYHEKYLRHKKNYYIDLLKKNKELKLIKTFGKLDIYEIPDKYYKPYIFSSRYPSDNTTDVKSYIDSGNVELNFIKINPVKYVVDVEAKEPFYLVFNEHYHPKWDAYVDGKEIVEHRMVNLFANEYYIDKIGKYRIEIKYVNQRLFVFGSIVSIISYIMLIIVILLSMRHKRT